MMPCLVAHELGHRFGRLVLFRRLSFTLEAGLTLAITGSNGSGKSTLLRILAGTLTPRKGTVELRLNGSPVEAEARPLQVGLVAPYLGVYDELTAHENLAFLARARRLPGAADRITSALDLVGLTGREHDRVATYSSGMRQRVKYATVLLSEPPLLLLDEPTANLDAAGIEMVERVMAYQQEEGRLLVVATNVAEEAARCDAEVCVEDYR